MHTHVHRYTRTRVVSRVKRHSGHVQKKRKISSISRRERIVDSNGSPCRTLVRRRGWGGIRFLIGEQSPENSHFVPARRVSVADSTSCLFRRQTIVPSFVYRASRLEKNGAHRCSKTSERIVPRASSRVCVQNAASALCTRHSSVFPICPSSLFFDSFINFRPTRPFLSRFISASCFAILRSFVRPFTRDSLQAENRRRAKVSAFSES